MGNVLYRRHVVPWAEQRQVEEDLIISRALVELFSDDFLPILRRVREVLEPWLGQASFERSPVAPKLLFRIDPEGGGAPMRLKVEINTRETEAYDEPRMFTHVVNNPWFTGEAELPSFSSEEMLATKLRALLQRDKGRDLYDLAHALGVFGGLDTQRLAVLFGQYLALQDQTISRAQAEQRMFAKLANPGFVADIRPLLSAAQAGVLTDEAIREGFEAVFSRIISVLPGEPWARTPEMAERFQVDVSV